MNDAPTIAVPGGQTIAEDTPLILGGALAIVVADVDATAPQVTLTAANGVITLASTAGLTFSAGDGLGNVTMTFTGSVAAINAALNGLEFLPDLNFSGAASIAVAVSDLGQSGAGGTLTAAGSIAIAVTAANDAPVAIADGYVIAEDGTLTVNAAAGVLANDTDSDGPAMTAVVVSGPANGVLVLNADGSFTYVPNGDFFGTDSFVYQASDGTLQSAATTVSITVTPVNDAPVYTVPGAQTVAEDTAAGVLRRERQCRRGDRRRCRHEPRPHDRDGHQRHGDPGGHRRPDLPHRRRRERCHAFVHGNARRRECGTFRLGFPGNPRLLWAGQRAARDR